MVRYDALRVMLALSVQLDLNIIQFDVKTAFFYGVLEEEVYMKIPEGLDIPDSDSLVCKLNKSIYGLKQSARCWNHTFSTLRYLKWTINYGLTYESSGSLLDIAGYCDSDYAGDQNTRRSTSGFIFKLGNNTISWGTKKQRSVALSTAEAEYVATATATKEVLYLRQLLNIDNQSALQLITNSVFHQRTKHIDVRYHFIREKFLERVIDEIYCERSTIGGHAYESLTP